MTLLFIIFAKSIQKEQIAQITQYDPWSARINLRSTQSDLTPRILTLYSTHKSTFNKVPDSHTTLSSYIWKLKDKGIRYEVKWSIKARGHAFSSGGRACNLCITEKLIILTADQNTTLNKRDELLETCRHRRKHLLVSLFKKKKPPATVK